MKELNKETYTKYDFIVNKTMEELDKLERDLNK